MAFISICGPPGIGKSTLTSSLKQLLGCTREDTIRTKLRQVAPSLWCERSRTQPLEILIQRYKEATRLALELWNRARKPGLVILDRGPEDLEFQISCKEFWTGVNSHLPESLTSEIRTLKTIRSEWVIYLDAEDAILKQRISRDKTRQRPLDSTFFSNVHLWERSFFQKLPKVMVLPTDEMLPNQVMTKTLNWLKDIVPGLANGID